MTRRSQIGVEFGERKQKCSGGGRGDALLRPATTSCRQFSPRRRQDCRPMPTSRAHGDLRRAESVQPIPTSSQPVPPRRGRRRARRGRRASSSGSIAVGDVVEVVLPGGRTRGRSSPLLGAEERQGGGGGPAPVLDASSAGIFHMAVDPATRKTSRRRGGGRPAGRARRSAARLRPWWPSGSAAAVPAARPPGSVLVDHLEHGVFALAEPCPALDLAVRPCPARGRPGRAAPRGITSRTLSGTRA